MHAKQIGLRLRLGLTAIILFSTGFLAVAAPVRFKIPAQPAPAALMEFSSQAQAEVVYSADDLKSVRANEVMGEYEPEEALGMLLRDTGYTARRNSGGKFVVTRAAIITGSVRGTLVGADGRPLDGVAVRVHETLQSTFTDRRGEFIFGEVAAGNHTLFATATGYQPLHITQVRVRGGRDLIVGRQAMRRLNPADGATNMEPFIVEAEGIMEMDPFEVTDQKVRPFSSPNVDIPRTINDAQPYYIFESRDIDRAGVVNVEQFIKRTLPMQTSGTSGDQGFFIGGIPGSVDLRGLGNNQTLVLLNGRRSSAGNLAVNGARPNFDFNAIPLAAIDRIEVLPTTASAIYGASAVGGVINIVLKRKYVGGEIKATYQNPDDTNAPMRKIDWSHGLTLEGGRTQIMLSAGYSDQKLLQTQDRRFMMTDYAWQIRQNTIAATGNVAQSWLGATPNIINSIATANLTLKPAYGGGSIGSPITFIPYGITPSTPLAAVGAALRANAGQVNADLPDTRQTRNGLRSDIGTAPRQTSFMATVRREMTPWMEFNGEFMYTGVKAMRNMLSITGQLIPAAAIWNPFTTAVQISVPIPGDGTVDSNNVTRRITTGLIVKLPLDWTAQTDFTWTQADNAYNATVGLSMADITAALISGTLNPFLDSTQYPYNLDSYLGYNRWSGRGTMNDLTLRLAGPVWELPGGKPQVAIGLERRQDGYKNGHLYFNYPNYPARDAHTLALGKNSITKSAYVEANIPILGDSGSMPFVRDVNLQLAWRIEDFNVRTGTSTIVLVPAPATPPTIVSNKATYKSSNPTIGLTWRPVPSLMVRTSYSEGFVPPTYSNLAAPLPSAFTTMVSDQRRGGAATSISTISGGNPDLNPETSESTGVGLVFEPQSGWFKGLRIGADYNFIDKQNNIASLSPQVMVDNEAVFPDRIIRDAAVPGDPFGVGRITAVNTSPVNLLRAFNEAVDVSVKFRKGTNRWGSFDFNALGTFGLKNARKTVINTPFVDYVGYPGYPLKFTGNATVMWDYRRWNVGWSMRYIPKLHVFGPPISNSLTFRQGQGAEWVPDQTYHDIFGSYRFPLRARVDGEDGRPMKRGFANRLLSGLEVQLAIYNVFRKIPPLDTSTFSSYGYSTYGDIRLRDIRISIKKAY